MLISTIGTTDAENEFRARQHRRNGEREGEGEGEKIPNLCTWNYLSFPDPMLSAEMRGLFLETPVTNPGYTAFYYSVSGEIIEAEGLKGKLGKDTVHVDNRNQHSVQYLTVW